MWVGIAFGILVFIATIIAVWYIMHRKNSEFAKVGKASYEAMATKSIVKVTRKSNVRVCKKCVGMCVRCNKTALEEIASICGECQGKQAQGKCAICKFEIGEGPVLEEKGGDVEAAIEHENENKG